MKRAFDHWESGGQPLDSLLEVGSGARGLSCILPNGAGAGGAPRFVGIDMKFAGPPAAAMAALTYDGGRLPITTRSSVPNSGRSGGGMA